MAPILIISILFAGAAVGSEDPGGGPSGQVPHVSQLRRMTDTPAANVPGTPDWAAIPGWHGGGWGGAETDFRRLMLRLVCFACLAGAMVVILVTVVAPWMRNRQQQSERTRRLKTVEMMQLAPRSFLRLLTVDDQLVLVGYDTHGVKAMVKLDDKFDRLLEGVPHSTEATEPEIHTIDTSARLATGVPWTQPRRSS